LFLERDVRGFIHNAHPSRVLFGEGTMSDVAEEVTRLGANRALVVCTPRQRDLADRVAQRLGELHAGTFPGAAMHTPVDVTERALQALRQAGADVVVSVGGGSTTGLGKALAARTDVDQVVLPTTYAGSEVTPVLGETSDGEKVTRSGPQILPETVIYDIELTLDLPADVTLSSAVNAMAHAVEALYAPQPSPVVDLMALEAVRALVAGLPAVHRDPHDRAGRSELMYGAWLAGTCLGAVGMGLHHKLCHVLGGSFGLPHAPTHTVVLPYVMAFNAWAAPSTMSRLSVAVQAQDAAASIQRLARELGGPTSLAELGLTHDDIAPCVHLATASPYPNPRPVTAGAVQAILTAALEGADVSRLSGP
jgi:alcohol dehydrogenase class IV